MVSNKIITRFVVLWLIKKMVLASRRLAWTEEGTSRLGYDSVSNRRVEGKEGRNRPWPGVSVSVVPVVPVEEASVVD